MADYKGKPSPTSSKTSTWGILNRIISILIGKKYEKQTELKIIDMRIDKPHNRIAGVSAKPNLTGIRPKLDMSTIDTRGRQNWSSAKNIKNIYDSESTIRIKSYYNQQQFLKQFREFRINHAMWLSNRWKTHDLAVKELSAWTAELNGFVNALNASHRELLREAAMLDPPVTNHDDLARMFALGFRDHPLRRDPRLANFLAVVDEYSLGQLLRPQLKGVPTKPRPLEPSVVVANWMKSNPRPPEPDRWLIPLREYFQFHLWGVWTEWAFINGVHQPNGYHHDPANIPRSKPANWTPDRTPDMFSGITGERQWSDPLPDASDFGAIRRAGEEIVNGKI